MSMSDRAFARAHDRYLEPPEESDDTLEQDECDLADIERQKRIDHEDYLAERYRQRQEDL